MTTEFQEGGLKFIFAAGVSASKYDDWAFYRNQFQNGCFRDNKAVDFVCGTANTTWLIEAKDYRMHERTKPLDLADEVAIKVRDTLAGLVAAQIQANDLDERRHARNFLKARVFRVVCHIEQPAKRSRLRPRAIEPDKLKQKLRTLIKAIDPHPVVTDRALLPADMPWQVHDE